MKRIVLALFLTVALASAVCAYEMDDTVIGGLNITDDVDDVLSHKQDKMVMLVFDSDTCVYCDLFKENVLADSNVQKELNDKYIVTLVDISEHPDVADEYDIFGTPITVVLDENGNEVYRLEGYVESDEFLDGLKEI